MTRVLIFANGHLPSLNLAKPLLHKDDFVIAVDGGLRHILALDCKPNVIIGDLDSINIDIPAWIDKGVEVIQFPTDKNETDLELAIQHALTLKPDEIIIVAALGERLDQTLGNLSLLGDAQLSNMEIRIDDGLEEVLFCRRQIQIHGRSGDIVSLLPWQGDVKGVQTMGLKWSLKKETLYPYKTRGISNELFGEQATIQIESGLLMIVHRRQTQNKI